MTHLQTAYASMFTEKYGSIIVMEHMTYAQALPLYGLRQNIFTDPQKPMKVESKIYPLNGADENSPCALTVDFALTYFLVSGELERSNQPVNLIITDASGMSVLTAWAAGKFSSSTVKKTFETLDIENKIKNRTLIIPGKVAVMKGEIQEKLPGWNVVVGPAEAVRAAQVHEGQGIRGRRQGCRRRERRQGCHHRGSQGAVLRRAAGDQGPRDQGRGHGRQVQGLQPRIPDLRHHRRAYPLHRARLSARPWTTVNPEPILKRAAEQIAAGATYLDVNIGPAEKATVPSCMTWAVKLLQENFNNVPLALDTANKRAIEAGIKVYNRTNGKPIVNSADAGSRISNIDLAAANDAICIALCSADGIAKDNEERMKHCHNMLERGMSAGHGAPTTCGLTRCSWLSRVCRTSRWRFWNAIKMFASEGLKSTGGLSNNSNGAPKTLRPDHGLRSGRHVR